MNPREKMIEEIKARYGLDDPRVFSVVLQVPREKFASSRFSDIAYSDNPIPIDQGQTMSQPYTVVFMTHLLDLKGKEKVLEIGTGSGYQAAILSKLAKEVYTIEVVPELADRAKKRLKKLGYKNIKIKAGSGYGGWENHAPYDAILITAGVGGKVPKELFDQLKTGGVLVAPVGKGHDKTMMKYRKLSKSKFKKEKHGIFHFVPFVKE